MVPTGPPFAPPRRTASGVCRRKTDRRETLAASAQDLSSSVPRTRLLPRALGGPQRRVLARGKRPEPSCSPWRRPKQQQQQQQDEEWQRQHQQRRRHPCRLGSDMRTRIGRLRVCATGLRAIRCPRGPSTCLLQHHRRWKMQVGLIRKTHSPGPRSIYSTRNLCEEHYEEGSTQIHGTLSSHRDTPAFIVYRLL